jgi:hypothetical protein
MIFLIPRIILKVKYFSNACGNQGWKREFKSWIMPSTNMWTPCPFKKSPEEPWQKQWTG